MKRLNMLRILLSFMIICSILSAGMIPASASIPKGAIVMWSGSITNIPSGWALCDGTNGTPDLRDRFIMGASGSDVGQTGGSNQRTLTVANLPSHSHGSGSLTTNSAGSHTHTGSTSNAGSHTHTGSTNSAGAHTHTGSTNTAGRHSHSSSSGLAYGKGASEGWGGWSAYRHEIVTDVGGPNPSFSISVGSAGDHSHTVTLNSAGAHTHTINLNNTGEHSHTLTTNSSGSHTHIISGSTSSTGSGTPIDNRPAFYKLAFIMKITDTYSDSDSRYYTKPEMDSLLDTKVDRAGDTMTGKLIVNSDIEVTGTVDTRNILQDGQKLDRTTASVVPVIKSVKGKNGETATTNSTFTLKIDAESAVQYRVLCEEFNSGWVDNPEITITGLDEEKLYQAVVEVENLVGNRSQTIFSFFRL